MNYINLLSILQICLNVKNKPDCLSDWKEELNMEQQLIVREDCMREIGKTNNYKKKLLE